MVRECLSYLPSGTSSTKLVKKLKKKGEGEEEKEEGGSSFNRGGAQGAKAPG